MTPQEFKISWANKDEPLIPLSAKRLNRFDLKQETKDFLIKAGLPAFAAPELSFVIDTDDIVYGIIKLTEQYNFGDERVDYDKYVVIGSCRDGDPIVINTSEEDLIEELDHGDLFSPKLFNSSINALAEFLVIYEDFKDSVLSEHGEEDYRNSYFTDVQFDLLKKRMLSVDAKAVTENGFWKDELEIMLTLRQEYLGN